MLGSASGSLPKYPGHPPAANEGLMSLVPDFNSWPSEGARLRRAEVAWSKRYDPLLRHEAEGVHRLGSLGQQTGTPEPKPDEHGPATCPEWLSSKQARGRAAKVCMHDAGLVVCRFSLYAPAERARRVHTAASWLACLDNSHSGHVAGPCSSGLGSDVPV